MNRKELIKGYIDFFKSKGHKEIVNESLIPVNDPTVLFTTAGMHPLVPYLMGQKHPLGKRLVNVQRCVRTQDINEVGDETHHTFFEMLGNWSLGDYWKQEAINFSFEFLTKVLGIDKQKLGVSVFGGDVREPSVSQDDEAANIWKKVGVAKERIAYLSGGIYESEHNWWGPAGKTGPCGPDTEMFYWRSKKGVPKNFDTDDKNWVEIWNDVLMQYTKNAQGKYISASQKNVDTGMGVERTLAVLNSLEDNYLTDSFFLIIQTIEELSGKDYATCKREMRIIADHVKASVFIIADGVLPGNSEQSYVLRRLIRRAVRYGRMIGLIHFIKKVAEPIFSIYDDYSLLQENKQKILQELAKEEARFLEGLDKGMKLFDKMVRGKKTISGKDAFLLYQSYGFPLEMISELALEKKLSVDEKGFREAMEQHQLLSQTASKGRFSSGLADHGEMTTRLHTATHLLHAALRKVLGEDVEQKGSNITSERLRFDFSFSRKLAPEEIVQVENLVNGAIAKKYSVSRSEMDVNEAKKSGALGFFEHKYKDKVSVYTVGKGKELFSCEICTGPHVANTFELGSFKIIKEEGSSAGVRRIKAILK